MSNQSRYPRIFERLYGRPLLLVPDKAFTIERVFQANLDLSSEAFRSKAFFDAPASSGDASGYTVTDGGVAIVQVMGTLVQRSSFMDALSGMTSYAEIGFNFAQAEADPKVKGILLEVDSGGGEVNGCFDLVDQIAASTKPVWCVANEAAYSAAYAIASAADKIIMPRTAGVGSIGVVALHVDESERDKKQGYRYTPVYAGDHKIDGHSHAPLPDDVQASIQADVDRLYQLFVSTVAQNRAMSADDVIATQADVFHPGAAIDNGLGDQVGTLDDAINQFEDFLAGPPDQAQAASRAVRWAHGHGVEIAASTSHPAVVAATSQGTLMDPKDTAASAASITPEALESARAEAIAAGRNEGVKTGAESERARVAAILGSDEAQGRTELATHLALETGMSSEDAVKLLAKSPRVAAQAAVPANAFATAMSGVDNPPVRVDVGDEGSETGDGVTEEAKAAMRIAFAGGDPRKKARVE